MTNRPSSAAQRLGVRWTIGDVNPYGFEALRLSVWGAWRIFGPETALLVCVNTISIDSARRQVGPLPPSVTWRSSTSDLPDFLKPHLSSGMAEGTAWKFSPLRVFADRYALALDNDVLLWEIPEGIRRWLEAGDPERCLVAEDVSRCFGQFEALCGPEPRNSGICGLPPGFDYEAALRQILLEKPVVMTSELDEQGLQVAALRLRGEPCVVTAEDVTICSPFPPHVPHLGRCGAHFVGLNTKSMPWSLNGRPATEYIREHWERHRNAVYERVGIAPESLEPVAATLAMRHSAAPDDQHSQLSP